MEDGTPEGEWPNPAVEGAREAGNVQPGATATILSRKFKAVRKVALDLDGTKREVKKGELLEPNDPLPALVPDAFESVTVSSKGNAA